MIVEITPAILSGKAIVPASKSIAHRALIASACSSSPCFLKGRMAGEDINATIKCLSALTAKIEKKEEGLMVTPFKKIPDSVCLDVGASGSTFRFMLSLISALGVETSFLGTKRMSERPIVDLLNELKRHGLMANTDKLPMTVKGRINKGDYKINAEISSQFITGLMLALPIVGGGKVLPIGKKVSSDYINITKQVLSDFGISVSETSLGYEISGKYNAPKEYEIESDWSSSAFFAVAGTKNIISLQGLNKDSTQGDKIILNALEKGGAKIKSENGIITVSKGEEKPFEFDIEDCPDTAPALAVYAMLRKGKSVLRGISRLKLKESDRAQEIVKLVRAFGGEVYLGEETIAIIGNGRPIGCRYDLPDDHRIAMSATIAGTFAKGKTVLNNAECVNKSYPSFFEDFIKLGGKANVFGIQ